MVLNYSIQNIATGQMLLGVAFQNLSKSEVFTFFDNLKELKTEITQDDNTCIFFIEDEKGVIYERYIESSQTANYVKDQLIALVTKNNSFFSRFTAKIEETLRDVDLKELMKDLCSGAAYATQRH